MYFADGVRMHLTQLVSLLHCPAGPMYRALVGARLGSGAEGQRGLAAEAKRFFAFAQPEELANLSHLSHLQKNIVGPLGPGPLGPLLDPPVCKIKSKYGVSRVYTL